MKQRFDTRHSHFGCEDELFRNPFAFLPHLAKRRVSSQDASLLQNAESALDALRGCHTQGHDGVVEAACPVLPASAREGGGAVVCQSKARNRHQPPSPRQTPFDEDHTKYTSSQGESQDTTCSTQLDYAESGLRRERVLTRTGSR